MDMSRESKPGKKLKARADTRTRKCPYCGERDHLLSRALFGICDWVSMVGKLERYELSSHKWLRRSLYEVLGD